MIKEKLRLLIGREQPPSQNALSQYDFRQKAIRKILRAPHPKMIGSSHKARTPAAETTATSTNSPAFAAPETDVPQKEGVLKVNKFNNEGE